MYIALLGRQPNLGIAELERRYQRVSWFSEESAFVDVDHFHLSELGGTIKAGRVIETYTSSSWRDISDHIVRRYVSKFQSFDGKITLGISAYGFTVSPRDIQKTGLIIKSTLKRSSINLRLLPQDDPALSTASSHHNKLGLSENKCELIVIHNKNGRVVLAESIGTQNITAYAHRDQGRPKRDAFVGMLPPKLAQIIVNLAIGPKLDTRARSHLTILDPFCGTGVILQEALLLGTSVYGTDLSQKMIEYSNDNLEWLSVKHPSIRHQTVSLQPGDATDYRWIQSDSGSHHTIDVIATETYLGQPFSAPPSPQKLSEVQRNCDHIISSFLRNIASQITPHTPLCLAVPAWRGHDGNISHLPLTKHIARLGYTRIPLTSTPSDKLLYFRDDQIVARELLLIEKQ